MVGMEILKPVVVLAGWTMVMWLWMYATRIPAMRRTKMDVNSWTGGTGKDLDGQLPDKVQWVAHNFNHLHESPTVFYAVALTLAVIGQGSGLNATLGWAYVGLRVLHSLIQATVNRVIVRFSVYMLSNLVLLVLVVHVLIGVFH